MHPMAIRRTLCFSGTPGRTRSEPTNAQRWAETTRALPGERKPSAFGTPGRTRTCDRRLRRPLLYPTELRARKWMRGVAYDNYRASATNEAAQALWEIRVGSHSISVRSSAHSDPLSRALDAAIAGRRQALLDLLARGSNLPGTRINDALADAFALACRTRGPVADDVALALARLSADEAPGATALEFLPVCGLLALGARASVDEGVRARFVAELHVHADDLRFRLRDAVVQALARIGQAAGNALVVDVESWMDGYFHAAAVLRALALDAWLGTLQDAGAVVARLEQAFALAQDAPRAAARWPGHKELLLALEGTTPSIAARFGVPIFDMLARWSAAKDPVLRETIAKAIGSQKLKGRYRAEIDRVLRALEDTRPAPRNPDHDVGRTRDRSRKRRRGGG
jgi:hypothetical protein